MAQYTGWRKEVLKYQMFFLNFDAGHFGPKRQKFRPSREIPAKYKKLNDL